MSAETHINDNGRHRAFDLLFSYRGRIGRLALAACGAVAVVGALAPLYVSIALAGNDQGVIGSAISAVMVILAVLALWPLTALLAKRLHDLNRSGWHSLWLIALWLSPNLMPDALETPALLAAVATLLALAALPGTSGPNAYGEPDNRPLRSKAHA